MRPATPPPASSFASRSQGTRLLRLPLTDLVRQSPNGKVKTRLSNVLGDIDLGRNVRFAKELCLALERRRAPEALKREARVWHLRELMREQRRMFKQ